MDPTEQDGARLLAPLREAEPATPSTVSVHRAVHSGTRRLRTRRAMTVVAAAGITALAGVLAVPVLSGPDREPVRPAAAAFDVMRQEFSVGSAGGYTPVSYETGRYRQRVQLRLDDGPQGTPPSATVTMYAAGREPSGWEPGGEPAPEVNGRRAFWLTGTVDLAWEWADGAWAFADIDGDGADARERIHRVAQSVEPGANASVTVPFTVPRPAPGDATQLVGVVTPHGTSSEVSDGALLVFSTQDAPRPGGGEADRVLVGVQRDPTRDLLTGKPRQAPPATIALDGGFSAVAEGPPGQQLLERARSVRLVANPDDRQTWTHDPLR